MVVVEVHNKYTNSHAFKLCSRKGYESNFGRGCIWKAFEGDVEDCFQFIKRKNGILVGSYL